MESSGPTFTIKCIEIQAYNMSLTSFCFLLDCAGGPPTQVRVEPASAARASPNLRVFLRRDKKRESWKEDGLPSCQLCISFKYIMICLHNQHRIFTMSNYHAKIHRLKNSQNQCYNLLSFSYRTSPISNHSGAHHDKNFSTLFVMYQEK